MQLLPDAQLLLTDQADHVEFPPGPSDPRQQPVDMQISDRGKRPASGPAEPPPSSAPPPEAPHHDRPAQQPRFDFTTLPSLHPGTLQAAPSVQTLAAQLHDLGGAFLDLRLEQRDTDHRVRRQYTVLTFPHQVYMQHRLWSQQGLATYLEFDPRSIVEVVPALSVTDPARNVQGDVSRVLVKWADLDAENAAYRIPRDVASVGRDRGYSERRRDAGPVLDALRGKGYECSVGFRGEDVVVYFDYQGIPWSSLVAHPYLTDDLHPYLSSGNRQPPVGFSPSDPRWRARPYRGRGVPTGVRPVLHGSSHPASQAARHSAPRHRGGGSPASAPHPSHRSLPTGPGQPAPPSGPSQRRSWAPTAHVNPPADQRGWPYRSRDRSPVHQRSENG